MIQLFHPQKTKTLGTPPSLVLGGGEVPEVGADVLIRRAALNQELVLGVEEQDVNRAMKERLGVNLVPGGLPNQLVAGVEDLKDFGVGRALLWQDPGTGESVIRFLGRSLWRPKTPARRESADRCRNRWPGGR